MGRDDVAPLGSDTTALGKVGTGSSASAGCRGMGGNGAAACASRPGRPWRASRPASPTARSRPRPGEAGDVPSGAEPDSWGGSASRAEASLLVRRQPGDDARTAAKKTANELAMSAGDNGPW